MCVILAGANELAATAKAQRTALEQRVLRLRQRTAYLETLTDLS
jgi:hypothetical protein